MDQLEPLCSRPIRFAMGAFLNRRALRTGRAVHAITADVSRSLCGIPVDYLLARDPLNIIRS
jgi:hypothetical protein